MNITILQGAFLPVPPKAGGAVEKMWFALGKDFAKSGHKVVHVSRTYSNFAEEEWIEGVFHKRIRGYTTPSSGWYLKWLDFLYTLRARKAIPFDSDIIVTNTFWAPILLSPRLRRRCMIDVARMPKGQIRWYKKSSRFRANSTPVVEAIKQEISVDLHRKVMLIPNPLPFYDLPKVDLTTKKTELLYAGRVHPEKGLELLIAAFKAIEGNWKLKIVGPWETSAGGGGLSYLKSLQQLAGTSNVEFTGPVFDMDKLNQFYSDASIFIYPSVAEKGETFGLAPLEAMAWGCVPIVSDLACFQDFIKNKSNGLIFNHRTNEAVNLLKDAIISLQQDNEFRFKLAQEAIKVRQTHSCSFIASLFLQEFKQMMTEIKVNR